MALGWWATTPFLRAPISAATLRAADLARRAALESYPLFLRSAKSPPIFGTRLHHAERKKAGTRDTFSSRFPAFPRRYSSDRAA